MKVIGIDPGKSGALWAIDVATRNSVGYYDIETLGTEIDIFGIIKWLKQFDTATDIVCSENPHPQGKHDEAKTVYAGFQFGKAVGIIQGIITTLGFKHIPVSPATWKAYFNLIDSKASYRQKKLMSVEKACFLSPADADAFRYQRFDKPVAKHDRAEAFLLAIYAIETRLTTTAKKQSN